MPQPQQVNLKIKGLYTAPNDFSGVPDGALDAADNIIIDQDNLAESRRGFEQITQSLPSSNDRIYRWTNYQGFKIVKYGASSLAYYNSGWNTYSGSYSDPDGTLARVRFIQSNQNLYISTSTGVKKLDVYSGTPAAAGVPKGLDMQLSLTGSSGFFTTNVVATVTGKTTNASPNLTLLSDITGIAAGQYVYGTGITGGTTVSSITSSATVLITTGDTTAGSTSLINLPTNSNLAAGQFITGTGIVSGTRISSISGAGPYTVTMSQAAIASGTTTPITFASDPIVTLSANATASGTGVSLTFSSGSQVAYRGLFGIRDANNNVLYGAPTQYAAITNNTGTSADVLVTMTIPSGITTSHFFQIYRSAQTGDASIIASDEEQLVYEGNPVALDLSNGYIQITDSTPDSLRGQTLYTSVSQEGIDQQNEPPPYCKDFCVFKGFALYGNTKSKQRKKLTILSVGSPNGIQANDTLVIGGITFTAKSAENAAAGQFKVFTSGTPAQNIADTANSLIKVINRYSTNTATYAFLLSGPNDLPGQLLLEERGVGGSSFAVTASAHGSAYSPALPTSGTSVSSAQDIYKNGILIAKSGQPEAVPSVNLLFAGDASQEILRVIPLREYVIILKQDGIFRFTGTSLNTFSIAPFDLTTKLLAPDSAVSLSNEVWGFFDQGVCSVSDTGVNVRSRPIETSLRNLIGTAISNIKAIAFGVGYETDRKYILALPNTNTDESCQFEYVFNTFTNAWTRWTRVATSGFVNVTEDKLYLGNGNDNTASFERKSNNYTDYVDEAFSVTITSSSSYSVVLSSVTGITVGDVLYQSATVASVVTGITSTTNTVTVQDLLTWSNGAASVLAAISSSIQWKPIVGGNPLFQRQYSEGAMLFKSTRFNTALISFYTDISQAFADTTLNGFPLGAFGLSPWGSGTFGGISRPRPLRFLVPQEKQICSQLSPKFTIRNGYSTWKCEGISISYNPISQEVG